MIHLCRLTIRALMLLAAVELAAQTVCTPDTDSLHGAISTIDSRSGVFEENRGQFADDARYRLRCGGLDLWVTSSGLVYDFYRTERRTNADDRRTEQTPVLECDGESGEIRRIGHVVAMRFDGASPRATAVGGEELPGRYNYFIGNDSTKWTIGVRRHASVSIHGIYPGINAVISTEQGLPRYDLVVAPGASPNDVMIRFDGATAVQVDSAGRLLLQTSLGMVEQRGLFAFQEIDGVNRRVECAFRIANDGSVGFAVGDYDPAHTLTIDPLTYSTFLGGSGDGRGTAVAADRSGGVYVIGHTEDDEFPTTTGAYDREPGNSGDVFVTKLNSNGTALVYSTFIGGSSSDIGFDIAVDDSGNAFITGYTQSSSYPTTPGAYSAEYNLGYDVIVTKLNSTGTALLYSTYIGGRTSDIGNSIAIDGSGNAYITGQARGSNFPSYPTTPGAFDESHNGDYDVMVTKLNSTGTALVYSTFLGGPLKEEAFGIAVDGDGKAYITGLTLGSYPTTQGAYDETWNRDDDVFVTKLNSDGTGLIYSTYIGGNSFDRAYGIAVDDNGAAYVAGFTQGGWEPPYPTTPGAHSTIYNGNTDGFVTKLNSTGTALDYSTFLGGNNLDYIEDIVCDRSGNTYVTGMTQGGTPSFPTTTGAYDETYNGKSDIFVTKLNSTGMQLLYSTFLGSDSNDIVYGIVYHGPGTVYVTGSTSSPEYPTTTGAYQETYGGRADAFVSALLIEHGGSDVREHHSVAAGGSCLYPNPVRTQAVLASEGSGTIQVQVIDVRGGILAVPHHDLGSHIVLDFTDLPVGVYFVRTRTDERTAWHSQTIVRME